MSEWLGCSLLRPTCCGDCGEGAFCACAGACAWPFGLIGLLLPSFRVTCTHLPNPS